MKKTSQRGKEVEEEIITVVRNIKGDFPDVRIHCQLLKTFGKNRMAWETGKIF